MTSKKTTTLYTPDGRKHETSDPTEITRLKAQGYSATDPKKPKASSKPTG